MYSFFFIHFSFTQSQTLLIIFKIQTTLDTMNPFNLAR